MNPRQEFLLAMYQATWANVTRAEDAIWKGMAAYTAVFAGLALATGLIGAWGFLVLVLLFGLFGMGLSLNANLWFARNIGIISNLEKEFLDPSDYGRIIPVQWKGKKVRYVNDEIWTIMTGFFFVVSLASIVIVGRSLAAHELALTVLMFVAGIFVVGAYGLSLSDRHTRFVAGAPGRPD